MFVLQRNFSDHCGKLRESVDNLSRFCVSVAFVLQQQLQQLRLWYQGCGVRDKMSENFRL